MRVHVDTHPRACVLLDGKDISDRCYEADDDEGWVGVFKVDDTGRIIADLTDIAHPRPVKSRLYGKVEITL